VNYGKSDGLLVNNANNSSKEPSDITIVDDSHDLKPLLILVMARSLTPPYGFLKDAMKEGRTKAEGKSNDFKEVCQCN